MESSHDRAVEASRAQDYLAILSGATQNVVGIGVAAVAMLVVQVLMTRTLGTEAFGTVTILTQAAFVASFATRAGMDMAAVRDVAVETGMGRWERLRAPIARAVLIAAVVSVAIALVVVAGEDAVRHLFSIPGGGWPVAAAALTLPFAAVTNVWLGATRGLKIMRYTLYVFWIGQNLLWILLMLAFWRFSVSTTSSILAYSLSWAFAAAAAGFFWRRESRGWQVAPPEPGWQARLLRYAGPRAPAALFAQLLFWTDLFVVTRYVAAMEVGVYSAALRMGQVLVLFLASVNLMFAPFVADLHNRRERERLDALYKTLTRWIVAATLPVFLIVLVAPGALLRVFGADFAGGRGALLILALGQLVNVSTGSAGFILIMVGRTGWDLAVYAGSICLDLAMAFWLCPRYGIEGAAIANAVTFSLSNGARLALVRRFVDIQPYDSRYARLLFPALVGGAAMWATHAALTAGYLPDLLVTGLIGTLAYLAAYLLVGLTPGERRAASRLLQRVRGSTR